MTMPQNQFLPRTNTEKATRNPLMKYSKLFLLTLVSLLTMALAFSSEPLADKQEQLQLFEFRLKTGDQLEPNELQWYCQLLCEVKGVCKHRCGTTLS